jgi:hypothetical protein
MDDKTIRKRIKEYYHQSIFCPFELVKNKIKEIQMPNEMFVGFFCKQEVNNLIPPKRRRRSSTNAFICFSLLYLCC